MKMMSHFTSDLFPKILICIPTLNKEEIIRHVLNNILSQSYPTEKMRILIVDGGSNDNTLGIAREILSNSNVDYKIIQRRSNIPEARNICIESMRDDEKALIFWDADILTNNNDLLRIMMKTSLEYDIHILNTSIETVFLKDPLEIKDLFNIYLNICDDPEIEYTPFIGMGVTLVRQEVVKSGLRFNEKLYTEEDRDFSMKAVLKRFCVATIKNCRVYNTKIIKSRYLTPYIKSLNMLIGAKPRAEVVAYSLLYRPSIKDIIKILYRGLLPLVIPLLFLLTYLFQSPGILLISLLFTILFIDFLYFSLKHRYLVYSGDVRDFLRLLLTSYIWVFIDLLVIIYMLKIFFDRRKLLSLRRESCHILKTL